MRPSSTPEPVRSITTLAVPTRNRVESLERCLKSFMRNAQTFGRTPVFFVADDSGEEEARRSRHVLKSLAEAHGAQATFAGSAERAAYVEALAEAGITPDVARFALFDVHGCGAAIGANRNAILLETVGESSVSADDDIVCQEVEPFQPQDGVSVYTGAGDGYDNYNPAEYWFFPSREATLSAVTQVDSDVLAQHERALGRSAGAIFADLGKGSADLKELRDPAIRARIEAGLALVQVTMQGTFGDIGWYAPTWYLMLTGESRARFVASDEVYRSACHNSREALRVVRRHTLTDGRFCQAAILGLDHSELLPPFFPVQRYEDGVFRMTLRTCFDDALFAHLPSALLHAPLDSRAFRREDIARTGSWIRTGEMMVQCIRSHEPLRGGPPSLRLRALGRHLQELGRLSATDFDAFLRARMARQKALYIEHYERLLDEHAQEPRLWAEDVRSHLEAIRGSLAAPDYVVPRDLLADGQRSPDEARRLARRLVLDFGRLLAEWPDVIAAARALRERGIRVSRPLAAP